MAISLQTSLKQTQKLAMTQTMKQSLELLQMSSLELQQAIQVELESNPLLEEDSPADSLDIGTDVDDLVNASAELDAWGEENEPDLDADRRRLSFENAVMTRESLADHLLDQIRLLNLSPRERSIMDKIATGLDDNGFFVVPRADFAHECRISPARLERLFELFYTLDPCGCGARDVPESLLAQARIVYPSEHRLHRMIEEHFDALAKLLWEKIAREMDTDIAGVMALGKLLQKLDPYPGRAFSVSLAEPVVPEARVALNGDEIIILFYDGNLPRLSINRYYLNMLGKKNIDKKLKSFIKDSADSGRRMIKNIFDRRVTLEKVIRSVMELQIPFLRLGPGNLRPLNYQAVAEKVGFHESTISRVIANKYIETDWGIFSLRYFFTNRTVGGEDGTAEKIMKMIGEIVRAENPGSPRSDEDIVRILKNAGIEVARRTVAKYREGLGIPSSAKRRRINMIKKEESV